MSDRCIHQHGAPKHCNTCSLGRCRKELTKARLNALEIKTELLEIAVELDGIKQSQQAQELAFAKGRLDRWRAGVFYI